PAIMKRIDRNMRAISVTTPFVCGVIVDMGLSPVELRHQLTIVDCQGKPSNPRQFVYSMNTNSLRRNHSLCADQPIVVFFGYEPADQRFFSLDRAVLMGCLDDLGRIVIAYGWGQCGYEHQRAIQQFLDAVQVRFYSLITVIRK